MFKFPRSLVAAAFAVGMVGLSAQAVEKELIPYSSAMTATATSENSSTRTAVKAINCAGLNADGQHSTSADDSWLAKNSGFPSGGIWYRVDLGDTYNLCSIKVWNYNYKADRGAKETDIYYSTAENPEGSTSPSSDWTLLRTVEIGKATGAADYTGMDPIDFYPVKARYVLFHIKSVWGSYGGLSEVQFFQMHPFGDCSLTRITDGEYELVGSVEGVDASDVKLVFSADGQEDVEIDLGPQTAGAAFERTVTVSDGLLTTCLYRAKLVSTNVAGVNEFEFSGTYFFCSLPKVANFMRKIDFALSAEAQAALGESAVADVPVAIRVSSDIDGFDYSDMNAGGTDVIFGSVEGGEITRYPYEVETWNPAGESVFWVKVPSLSAATTISMCYGNNVFVPDNTPADVWSDYAVVFHGGTFAEATEKGVAGSAGSDKVTASVTSGWLGGGFNKSTCNSIGLNFTNPVNAGALSSINQMTVSGWYRPTLFKSESTTVNSGILAANRKSWGNDGNGFMWLVEAGTYLSFSIGGSHNGSKTDGLSWSKDNWSHFAATYDNKTYANYCNGVLLKSGAAGNTIDARTANSWTFGGYAMTAASDNFCGDMDELRVYNGAASADYLNAEYLAMLPTTLAAGPAELIDETAPIFETPVVSVSADGTVTVSITVISGEGDVYLMVDGVKVEPKLGTIGTDITIGTPFVAHPAIAANDSASVAVYGINAKGTEIVKSANGGVMNAAVVATVVINAQEVGLGKGRFAISRAEGAADDESLVVNLAWSGTGAHPAVADRNYVDDLPESVTIPAGEDSVSVVVSPLIDRDSTTDTELSLTIAGGAYISGATAAMTILHLVAPAEYNTWIAAADGLASDASNWSQGVPQSSHKILFDPQFSNANCEWDGGVNGLSTTVAEWMQSEGFTGMVTIDTEFSGTALTISGDAVLSGGKWSHRGNYNNYGAEKESNTSKLSSKRWCLNVQIGGNLTVGAGASIDVSGKGFGHPGNQSAPCYGGYCYNKDQSCAPYGSITEPFDPGMGCRSQGDQNKSRSGIGGGAVKLVVGGDVIVNGSISALGNVDLNVARSGGTGGSIWIDANQISGTGTINASGCPPSNYTSDQGVAIGSGGRIALYTKSALAISRDKLFCSGSSYSGTGGSKTKVGSCGTIYIKDPSTSNGVLLLKQDSSIITVNSANSAVPLLEDMTLDGIEFRGWAVLAVETGKTLTLPGGLASVVADSMPIGACGISYRGGTLNIGAGNQTVSGWMLEPVSNFTFAAGVTLSNAGAVGIIKRNICGTGDAPIPPQKIAFTVSGDMSVDETSAVDVGNVVGYVNYDATARAGWYGGWTTYYDKIGNMADARGKTFGSVFDPQDVGSSPARSYLTGGVLDMTVVGELVLSGKINANGPFSDSTADNTAPSSGGSINMTVGSVSGTGSITACGGAGRRNYAGGGGGGRIAIKLTTIGAIIPSTITVNAQGRYGYAFSAAANKLGSAGTVYEETAEDGAKGGTITISNWPDRGLTEFTSATVFPTTPIVAYNNGDAVADFKDANLVVTNNAIAEVSVAALKMRNLAVAANSKLDLYGNTLTVKSAKLGDTKLAAGTYAASDYSDYLADTVGGGSLVVKPAGMKLILR